MPVAPHTPLAAMERDGNTADFLDATARGQFLLRRCTACRSIGGPQEPRCARCGSVDTEWVPAGGGARIVSWSVVHGRDAEGVHRPQSINVIAEFDEGPWWWSQIFDADPDQLHTGQRLTVDFEPDGGGEMLPVFRLAI